MHAALDLTFAIGCVLAVWAGLLLLLAGLGRGLLRLAGGRDGVIPDLATTAWAGYAGVIALLQIWHLALPVDGRALTVLAVLSAAGWAATRGRALPFLRPPFPILLALGVLTLWLADRAIGPCSSYDSANYQIPLVRWYLSYPAVPGLANLNPLYGLNPSGLLFSALLEQGPGTGRSHHFANGFLLLLILLLLARLLGGLLGRSERPAPEHAVALILLFPTVVLVNRASGNWISSHSTDLSVAAAVFATWCLLAEGLTESRNSGARPGPRLFTGLALLAVVPCLKATTAVFAATAWAAIASHLVPFPCPRNGEIWKSTGRALVSAAAFGTAVIAPWLVRNALLSGYPLFPATAASLPVDWRLPFEHAQGYLWWTRAYTRTPEAWDMMADQHGASWIPFWLRTELRVGLLDSLLPLGIAAVLTLAAWVLRHRRKARDLESRHPAILLLPFVIAVPVWFVTAPSVRYGIFLFWPLGAQVAAQSLPPALATPRVRQLLPALALLWCASAITLQGHYAMKYHGARTPREALIYEFFTPPGPDHGFHPLFQPALQTVRVCGLDVHLPAARVDVREPPPWPETLPWNSPPPSTALLFAGLCPRQPGNRPEDLAAGFRIAGSERPWAERNAAEVLAVAERTGWPLGRLAVYFVVRPEVIEESLKLAGRRAKP